MEYKIYKIVCNETGEVYIGKTTRKLEYRLSQHHRIESNLCTSKQIILRENYVMSQIDECDTEEESILLEAYYIRNTDNCVNIQVPGRTQKEWWQDSKDKIKIKRKEYYEAHRDEILEKRKETYTCECGSIFTKTHKSRHEKESKKHQNFINSK